MNGPNNQLYMKMFLSAISFVPYLLFINEYAFVTVLCDLTFFIGQLLDLWTEARRDRRRERERQRGREGEQKAVSVNRKTPNLSLGKPASRCGGGVMQGLDREAN